MPCVDARRETALTRDATTTTQMYASVRRAERHQPPHDAAVDGRALLPSAATAALAALTFSNRLQKSRAGKTEKRGGGRNMRSSRRAAARKSAGSRSTSARSILTSSASKANVY